MPTNRRRTTSIPLISRVSGAPQSPHTIVSSQVAAPANIFTTNSIGLKTYAIAGVFSGNLVIPYSAPALAVPTLCAGKLTLTSFPSPFTLSAGTIAFVVVSSTISPANTSPTSLLLTGLSAAFVYGPNSTPAPLILTPGIKYTQPAVYVTIVIDAAATLPAGNVTVLVQAILLGAVGNAPTSTLR